MMVVVQTAAWALPELAVAIFALAVWVLALAQRPAGAADAAMLRAQQTITLGVALISAALFLQHSGWVEAGPAMRWCYLAIAVTVPLGTRLANRSSGLAWHPLEGAYWLASALVLLALVWQGGLFVTGERLNPLGFPQATTGWGGPLLVAMHCAAIAVGARRRMDLADNAAFPGGASMNLTWAALILASALEQASMHFRWALPPVFWAGALALCVTFTRSIQSLHLELARALEHTLGERDALREQVTHDDLTGLLTRARGELELARALELQSACVLFLDLDDFKRWNDRYSHATGDRVLHAVAQVLKSKTRASDVAARYAGDEFFVALLGANLNDGQRIAGEIEAALEALRFEEASGSERVQASIGVVLAAPGESVTGTLHRADLELYRIKRQRGRVMQA